MHSYGRSTSLVGPFDREFSSFFDDLFSSQFDWGQTPRIQFKCSSDKFPLTNAELDSETKDIFLSIALAGYKKDNLKIRVEGNRVIVSGSGGVQPLSERKKLLQEITTKGFEVAYLFPDGKYDLEKMEVKFEDGLLLIEIPAKESERPKEITIK